MDGIIQSHEKNQIGVHVLMRVSMYLLCEAEMLCVLLDCGAVGPSLESA